MKSKFVRLVNKCLGKPRSPAARNSLLRSPRSSIPDQRSFDHTNAMENVRHTWIDVEIDIDRVIDVEIDAEEIG